VIVAKQKQVYMATTNRQAKNKIALQTMQKVKAAKKGSRFLQKVKQENSSRNHANDDDDDGDVVVVYEIAKDKVVLEKIKQALRHLDRPKRSNQSDAAGATTTATTTSTSTRRKDQETIKLSSPLQHHGVLLGRPAQQVVGPPWNAAFYPPDVSRSTTIAHQQQRGRSAAFSLGNDQHLSMMDNLRHFEFQEQINTALRISQRGGGMERETQALAREKQAIANATMIALMEANARNCNNSAAGDSTSTLLVGSILKEYGGLSRTIGRTTRSTAGPGIHQLLSSVSSPFSAAAQTRRGGGGGGLTSSSYLGERQHHNRAGLSLLQQQQQGDQDQAAVAALRDSSARVMEVLALLGKNPVDANAFRDV
jgi:hypothetical protein